MEKPFDNYSLMSLGSIIPFFRSIKQKSMSPVLDSGRDYTDTVEDHCAGIWQGRFQVIHNGHHHVFEASLTKFELKMIAIVNPHPANGMRPCDYDNFLNSEDNPFTFFQRMLFWKIIVDDYNDAHPERSVQVIMFPCWHAQEHLEFEKSEFLPTNRSWIVPFKRNADTSNDPQAKKAYNLQRVMNEKVYRSPLEEEDQRTITLSTNTDDWFSLSELHASRVRNFLDKKCDGDYSECIPNCIGELQKRVYLNIHNNKKAFQETNLQFVAVPFIGNKINLYSLQEAINVLKETENAYIVFVVSIRVEGNQTTWDPASEDLPWWFKSADQTDVNHNINYLSKAKMINELMKELGVRKFLITPIFVMQDSFSVLRDYNDAFLPPFEKTTWIIDQTEMENGNNSYYRFGFIQYLSNREAATHIAGECAIDNMIRSFYNKGEKYHEFANKAQIRIYVDPEKCSELKARVLGIESKLNELAKRDTPPEKTSKNLISIQEIKRKLQNGDGWSSEQELASDQATIKSIIDWLSAIEGE